MHSAINWFITCTTPHCIAVHMALRCTALQCNALHRELHCTAQGIALHCTALHCTAQGTALHYTALHCTAQGTVLHCTAQGAALHCTALDTAVSHCQVRLLVFHENKTTMLQCKPFRLLNVRLLRLIIPSPEEDLLQPSTKTAKDKNNFIFPLWSKYKYRICV